MPPNIFEQDADPGPAAMAPLVLRADSVGITTLTLNRPRQFNALSTAMLGQLQAALDEVAADAAVRVVVLTGAGAN